MANPFFLTLQQKQINFLNENKKNKLKVKWNTQY